MDIHGFKRLHWVNDRFVSPYTHTEWDTDFSLVAKCGHDKCSSSPNDNPGDCMCGIHLAFSVEWLMQEWGGYSRNCDCPTCKSTREYTQTVSCLVAIHANGKVIVHEKGLRVARARVVSLVQPPPNTYTTDIYGMGLPILSYAEAVEIGERLTARWGGNDVRIQETDLSY